MSNAQSAVVGGGGLLTIAGRTFVVHKPSAQDEILMQKWLLAQPLKSSGINTEELAGLSEKEKLIVLREVAKNVRTKRSPSEADLVELLYSPGGVAMQIWLAARHDDPTLKFEDVKGLVTEANAIDLSVALDEAVKGIGEDNADPKAPAGSTSPSPT